MSPLKRSCCISESKLREDWTALHGSIQEGRHKYAARMQRRTNGSVSGGCPEWVLEASLWGSVECCSDVYLTHTKSTGTRVVYRASPTADTLVQKTVCWSLMQGLRLHCRPQEDELAWTQVLALWQGPDNLPKRSGNWPHEPIANQGP